MRHCSPNQFDMKKSLLPFFALVLAFLLPIITFAQQNEGEITYLQTVKLDLQVEGMDEEMLKMLPTSQRSSMVLLFNPKTSLYKNASTGADEAQEINHSDGEGMNFTMKIQQPENQFYKDFEKQTIVESREFFGRYFLIEQAAEKQGWKMTGEQKQVLGYRCMKATLQKDSTTAVEAWFTPQIPVPAGPGEYGQLPGVVLELSINSGQRTLVATSVDLKALPENAIERPTKGKKVTREEFDKIVEEKTKEMGAEMGGSGGGTVKMIIRN